MRFAIEDLFRTLRDRAPGVQALVLFGRQGERLAHAAVDPRFASENFASEYATFLRIARRTAEDTGIGDVDEQILVTPTSFVVMRRLPDQHYAAVVCSSQELLGRVRYELKRSLLYSPFFDYELERT